MNDLQDRLRRAFQQEARDYLEELRAMLRAVDGGARLTGEQVDEACRLAHSLKGAARAVDLPDVERLSHHLEGLLDGLRGGGGGGALIGRILDAVEDQADSLGGDRRASDCTALLDALERGQPLPDAAPGRAAPQASALSQAPADRGRDNLRVEAARLDRILEIGGEIVAQQARHDAVAATLADLERRLGALQQDWGAARRALDEAVPEGASGTVAGQVETFEMKLRQAIRLAADLSRGQSRTARGVRQLTEELQQELQNVRTVPLRDVLGSLAGMARDLAAEQGVAVRVETTGLEARADRMVLQRLKDPLIHLLRNAISHGLEPESERLAAGKPGAGLIAVDFSVADGLLTVRLADDGRGIDPAAVLAAGRRLGLVPAGRDPGPDEVAALLFAPGFTTRREVTALAGRGMGLSIVKQAVLRLGGQVTARRRIPAGAEFHITLPVMATGQDFLLVEAAGRLWGLPAERVDRLHRVVADDIGRAEGRPVLHVGGNVVPLASLAEKMGAGGEVRASRDAVPVVVVKAGERRLALACDRLLGVREALVKDLGAPLPVAGTVTGALILDDGALALAVNVFGLLDLPLHGGDLTVVDRAERRRNPVILVADDSMTTRTLQKSILEAYGYEVRTAVDGLQALGRLRAERIDLVITDVQMPQMDGFGLLAAIREDSALGATPVVLVTSLGEDQDRARGLALGADAYIVKRDFSQDAFLATIRQLL